MYASEATLRENDLEGYYEFPPRFDQGALEKRSSKVHRKLQTLLRRKLKFEGPIYNQDASFSVAIRLADEPYRNMRSVCDLRFSNFGNFVTVTREDYFGTEECRRVLELAAEYGFVPVSHAQLDRAYDGINGDAFDTWWIRYFDWL